MATDVFLTNRRLRLSDFGFQPDPGKPAPLQNTICFYHFTQRECCESVLREGLQALRPVVCPRIPAEFNNKFLVEGFLEPLPKWLSNCPHFGDLGLRLTRHYIGNVLLRVELPLIALQSVYVADYAHKMEIRHFQESGLRILKRNYDLRSPDDIRQAYVLSYTPIADYTGGFVAPVVQFLNEGPGIAIPPSCISLHTKQPLAE